MTLCDDTAFFIVAPSVASAVSYLYYRGSPVSCFALAIRFRVWPLVSYSSSFIKRYTHLHTFWTDYAVPALETTISLCSEQTLRTKGQVRKIGFGIGILSYFKPSEDKTFKQAKMPYPMARTDDPVHLKTFDPKTFYPAIGVRSDSLSIYPSSSVSQTRPPRPSAVPSYVFSPRSTASTPPSIGEAALTADAEIHSSAANTSETEFGFG